jgi:uncharacterized protein (DUF924 family)
MHRVLSFFIHGQTLLRKSQSRITRTKNKTAFASFYSSKMSSLPTSTDVLTFWFKELSPPQWFTKSSELDMTITARFSALHTAAAKGEICSWRSSPEGCLAEIIILDQFSRNIYRDNPKAFAQDQLALELAQLAVGQGFDEKVSVQCKMFLYMPFMHSEKIEHHAEALKLFAQDGLEHALEFEKKHLAIIEKFGRYPHRNKILGRESTQEELEFLEGPDSSF